MERIVFASDGNYYLCPLIEADRSVYRELYNEGSDKYNDNKYNITDDWAWNRAISEETKVYMIINKNDEICGNIELQKPESDTPEIGIRLFEKFENMGIAKVIVPLFIRAVCGQQNVLHFVIRIRESNTHSIHVFEKLGAEPDHIEESPLMELMNKFEEIREYAKQLSHPIDKSDPVLESTLVYKLDPGKYL
ncbi:MAG: GNAT family N-acetyltransferase [Huintestinicola sp.]